MFVSIQYSFLKHAFFKATDTDCIDLLDYSCSTDKGYPTNCISNCSTSRNCINSLCHNSLSRTGCKYGLHITICVYDYCIVGFWYGMYGTFCMTVVLYHRGYWYGLHNILRESVVLCTLDFRLVFIHVHVSYYLKISNKQRAHIFLPAITWLKYCRYGVKSYPIKQSINQSYLSSECNKALI